METHADDATAVNTCASSSRRASMREHASESSATRQLEHLIDLALCACYDQKLGVQERRQQLKHAQDLLQQFAQTCVRLEDNCNTSVRQLIDAEMEAFTKQRIALPCASFVFRDNGQMHLPIIDWSGFRGYSVALWIKFERPQEAKDERFVLFRFTNSTSTLGVEATLQFPNSTNHRTRLFVQSKCSASTTTSNTNRVNPAPATKGDWKRIEKDFDLSPDEWHLLTISHSLHYVKKSKVSCFVDTKLQFQEELAYPSSMITASKCTIGGGQNGAALVQVANVTMFQDELSAESIAVMFALGPMLSSFNRFIDAPIGGAPRQQLVGDYYEVPWMSPAPAAKCLSEWYGGFQKLHITFCFSADDLRTETEYPDLVIERMHEGTIEKASHVKWVTLEGGSKTTAIATAAGATAPSVPSASSIASAVCLSEIQQRNARLDKHVTKHVVLDPRVRWYQVASITGIPVLLHYWMVGYELAHTTTKTEDQEAALVDPSAIFAHLMVIMGQLLRNHGRHQDDAVVNHAFHLIAHVLMQHKASAAVHSIVSCPQSMILLVAFVRQLASLVPIRSAKATESICKSNPLFASGIRTLLLSPFAVWRQGDFKTQSILCHQLSSLASEFPHAFNDIRAVEWVLDILHDQYASKKQDPATADIKQTEWKQQCIQTLVEVIEVCLTNQSVAVFDVKEKEVLDPSFSGTTRSHHNNNSSSPSASNATSSPSSDAGMPRERGGVLRINLESILWSDQAQKTESGGVLPFVQVRFTLLRNLRRLLRFLVVCDDPVVSIALIVLLRRLAVSFLDMRFALVSSNALDCLLFLLKKHGDGSQHERVQMACFPLLIYFVDWLESIQGRTIWCGIEEQLRWILSQLEAPSSAGCSRGFLELMLEFYFDPAFLLGVQHSILMNDPPTAVQKDSVLFPIASPTAAAADAATHENGNMAIVSENDTTSAARPMHAMWKKMVHQFHGQRVPLAWEKRIAVIKKIAQRHLTSTAPSSSVPLPLVMPITEKDPHPYEWFGDATTPPSTHTDEKILASLPLKSVLPFFPILLRRKRGQRRQEFQERVLLEMSVKLKTDEQLQHTILAMRREWTEAAVEIALACAYQEDDAVETHGRDAGEDLAFDITVSLLCAAMQEPRGWRSISDLAIAVKAVRHKYTQYLQSQSHDSLLKIRLFKSMVFSHPLQWIMHVVTTVLQRLSKKTRTILSRPLAENVHKLLVLVHETLLAFPLEQQDGANRWVNDQLMLLDATIEMLLRLAESTHKAHRIGLVTGVKILQHALAFVSDLSRMSTIVNVLEMLYQQEMSPVAAMRIYDGNHDEEDNLAVVDVFRNALVCFRRALVVHCSASTKDETLLSLLRQLILRIASSGLFTQELHGVGLTVEFLSVMSEAQAVTEVLESLSISIDDMEMREKEKEATRKLRFPVARELRYAANETLGFVDEQERVLWAAVEVEANRMLEIMIECIRREETLQTVDRPQQLTERDEWMRVVWDRHEWIFRSQHWFHAFPSISSSMSWQERLRRCFEKQSNFTYRIGAYECPMPGRMRRTIDYFPSPEAPSAPAPASSPKMTLQLETASSPVTSSWSPLGSPRERANEQLLLEQVARVVAEKGVNHSGSLSSLLSVDNEQVIEEESSQHEDEEETEQKPPPPLITAKAEPQSTSSNHVVPVHHPAQLPMTITALSRPYFQDLELDPGPGQSVVAGDAVVARVLCRRVIPEGLVYGTLYFCTHHLVFEPSKRPENPASTNDVDIAPGLHRNWRWRYRHVQGVYLRRYRLRDSAMELFVQRGTPHFLDFHASSKSQRNEYIRLLYSFLPRGIPKQWPGRSLTSGTNHHAAPNSATGLRFTSSWNVPHLSATTKAWQQRQLSNFEYLMALNTFAGRSFNDLTQYPVFPWILSNYEDEVLDLSDPRNFRDLSKPVGALNPARLEEFWERYHAFEDPQIPKFLYGSHYSTCAGVVLFFLFRLQPFANLQRKMQGGTFDLPDRLFTSMQETWDMCNSQMSEVKELIPEFFMGDGTFLKNVHGFALGKRQFDGQIVQDVQLPPWANGSTEEFIRIHRAALESEYVSSHLHLWIDLIFGFKQRGKAALDANNLFYYLTYYGVIEDAVDRIQDPLVRESMELQIAHFGQCPMQLFRSAHPKRHAATFGARKPPTSRPSIVASTKPTGGATAVESTKASTAASAAVPRPLGLMFQDTTPTAQQRRQEWSPCVEVKPLVKCGSIRLLKILADRFVSINELGVIELYYWKLVPRPSVAAPPSPPPQAAEWAVGFTPDDAKDHGKDMIDQVSSEMKENEVTALSKPEEMKATCPWLLEIVRDDSPFDYVPRVPVFEVQHPHSLRPVCPMVIAPNGRLVFSGGARNGAIHLRLLDLDNGHVLAKASVCGHSDAVSCLSLDKWTHSMRKDFDESDDQCKDLVVVSGSMDHTLAVWRVSRVKADDGLGVTLPSVPRISSTPLLILRGHRSPLVDCHVNTNLGLVVSCSRRLGLVHFIHQAGQVAFAFYANDATATFAFVRASNKGFILSITKHMKDGVTRSSSFLVYTLAGVLVQSVVLAQDDVVDVQLSPEGDLVMLALASTPGRIRFYRLDDFVLVQEYICPSSTTSSPIAASSIGPREAMILLASGHDDGSLVFHLLPDADGSVSFLTSMRRLLGVQAKLKMVKGTVQQAQSLALSTIGNAVAVTTTARDIAGEAIGEAKTIVKGLFSYLSRQTSQS